MEKMTRLMRLLVVLLAVTVLVGMGYAALLPEEEIITAPQQTVELQAAPASSRGGVHPASSVLSDGHGVTPAAQDAAIQSGNGLTVAHDNTRLAQRQTSFLAEAQRGQGRIDRARELKAAAIRVNRRLCGCLYHTRLSDPPG